MANGPDTAGPEGAARAIAAAKNTLAETHKHFGDNPDYAPKKPATPVAASSKSDYSHARDARSFAGVEADKGAEYKGASEAHDANVAALHQQ